VGNVELLVVEDDERIGSSLTRALRGQGYTVEWARDGAEALARIEDSTTLVILDLGLPDIDGIDLCRSLRARDPSPHILILTARRDEVDVVVGLEAGADDYIVKPFGLAELLARIRVCERRQASTERVVIGDLEIEVGARRVSMLGAPVELSLKEFELLLLLARHAGTVVRRTELVESIWDEHWFGSTRTIDTHVWALRRKLDVPDQPSRITTVRGVGYRLEHS
jgi:DNA-binding response OmpR family regulator